MNGRFPKVLPLSLFRSQNFQLFLPLFLPATYSVFDVLECAVPCFRLLPCGRMANKTASSPRRLAANRANAQKSTGPRTLAGKVKSSLNAVKTGLTGHTVLLPQEDVTLYQAHVARFHEELKPVGELETNTVQSLADTQWRLNRIPGLESALLALGRKKGANLFPEEKDPRVRALLIEGHVFNSEAQPLKNLYLQENRLRRQYARDIQELNRLREEREKESNKQIIKRMLAAELASKQKPEEECGCENCRQEESVADGFEFSNGTETRQKARKKG